MRDDVLWRIFHNDLFTAEEHEAFGRVSKENFYVLHSALHAKAAEEGLDLKVDIKRRPEKRAAKARPARVRKKVG